MWREHGRKVTDMTTCVRERARNGVIELPGYSRPPVPQRCAGASQWHAELCRNQPIRAGDGGPFPHHLGPCKRGEASSLDAAFPLSIATEPNISCARTCGPREDKTRNNSPVIPVAIRIQSRGPNLETTEINTTPQAAWG